MNCLICNKELKIINTHSKNVLHSKCFDCDLLFVINISGIYHSGYVSFMSDWEENMKHLAKMFIRIRK